MTEEEMNRTMEFILNTLANITVKQEQNAEAQLEAQKRNEEAQKRNEEETKRLQTLMELGWQETRYAVDKLMIAVENDREFMQQVARLAIATEQRVTMLEERSGGK